MSQSEHEDASGPQFEMWIHLDSGLDMARMELERLDEQSQAAVEAFAKMVVPARRAFVLERDQEVLLKVYDYFLEDPWFRFAADIEIAEEAIERATGTLRRFKELRPVLTGYKLGERASRYLREVIEAFLFGFDAASIALCGATLEQVLRDLVLQHGIYTEGRLRRERPSALTLLKNAERAGVTNGAERSAERVLGQRNRVMHQHIWDEKVLKNVALGCIEDLGKFLVVVGES